MAKGKPLVWEPSNDGSTLHARNKVVEYMIHAATEESEAHIYYGGDTPKYGPSIGELRAWAENTHYPAQIKQILLEEPNMDISQGAAQEPHPNWEFINAPHSHRNKGEAATLSRKLKKTLRKHLKAFEVGQFNYEYEQIDALLSKIATVAHKGHQMINVWQDIADIANEMNKYVKEDYLDGDFTE